MCITIDFGTLEEDDTVTIRDRDTMAQERVPAAELGTRLRSALAESDDASRTGSTEDDQ